jgi:hypothetical protein
MRNSVADSVCVGSVGGTGDFSGIKHTFEAKEATIPWVENVKASIPAKPTHYFIVTATIDTTDPQNPKIAFPAANTIYTTFTQILPAPAPSPPPVQNYGSSMVGAFWTSSPTVIGGSWIINEPTKQVPPIGLDKGEIELNLVPSSPPTANTEG